MPPVLSPVIVSAPVKSKFPRKNGNVTSPVLLTELYPWSIAENVPRDFFGETFGPSITLASKSSESPSLKYVNSVASGNFLLYDMFASQSLLKSVFPPRLKRFPKKSTNATPDAFFSESTAASKLKQSLILAPPIIAILCPVPKSWYSSPKKCSEIFAIPSALPVSLSRRCLYPRFTLKFSFSMFAPMSALLFEPSRKSLCLS